MSSAKNIVILGATGSIGRNAVSIARMHPDRFNVLALVARNNLQILAEQAAEFDHPTLISTDPARLKDLRQLAPADCDCATGEEAMLEMVCRPEVDLVLCAIVGTSGIKAVLKALEAGKDVALASKEVLVAAGELAIETARRSGAKILPVDSEHSAIFQCLNSRSPDSVSKIILTASGGPFFGASREELKAATWEKALAHPTWDMGPKVTIDSATMMNKALEIVEAGYLFDLPAEQIDVVIHRESIVHSMVQFIDGSVLAQLAPTDMRFAIQYAMSYPQRLKNQMQQLDFSRQMQLSFSPPDRKLFPSIDFALEALKRGGTLPAAMNAANEVAVEKFRQGAIAFTDIWSIIERVMCGHQVRPQTDLETVMEADAEARRAALNYCEKG